MRTRRLAKRKNQIRSAATWPKLYRSLLLHALRFARATRLWTRTGLVTLESIAFSFASNPNLKYDAFMTQLLQDAFTEASKLSEADQDAFASLLLAELQSEQRWTKLFSASQAKLATLADEALAEFEAGQTLPLDLDRDFTHD